jgi:hypothetical protein
MNFLRNDFHLEGLICCGSSRLKGLKVAKVQTNRIKGIDFQMNLSEDSKTNKRLLVTTNLNELPTKHDLNSPISSPIQQIDSNHRQTAHYFSQTTSGATRMLALSNSSYFSRTFQFQLS